MLCQLIDNTVSMASDNSDVIVLSQSSEVAEREFVRILIALYRDNPHLWDSQHPDYLHKKNRIRTLIRICETLKAYKPNYTVEQLKKKINILRTNFNKERHKIEARRPAEDTKNSAVVKEAETCLWYYNELLFLVEQGKVPPAKSFLSIKSTSQNRRLRPFQKKKRIPESSSVSNFKSHENEAELITKYWALRLQRLAPDQRIFAEKIINDTLFEGAMGSLTRHGVTFLPGPPSFVECSNDESHSPVYVSQFSE